MVRAFTSSSTEPRQRGLEFGRAHATEVARTVGRYDDLFRRRGGPGFDPRRWALRFREVIGDLAPDALTEIGAIAEGARVDEAAVVALNARTEILAKADPFGERECSAVLVTQPRVFGVQTWDWYAAMADSWLVWRTPRPGGGWMETVTEHGMLAKIGLNDAGLGVHLNILHHQGDAGDGVGLPVHLVSHRILTTARTVEEARVACATPVVASTSLTLLDEAGGVMCELFPGGRGEIAPGDGGVLIRTNHFLSAAGSPGCLTGTGHPSTQIRLDELTSLTADPPRSPDEVLSAMRHHHPDGGVCRHPDGDLPEWQRTATLATVVIEPDRRRLTAYDTGPCGVPTSGARP